MIARAAGCFMIAIAPLLAATAALAAPETVYFESVDGVTEIVGYLFRPACIGPHPAVVMLHAAPDSIPPTTMRIARLSRGR
jgi:dipeptidyl aminopeptidase/acylaminoacyl peptidase